MHYACLIVCDMEIKYKDDTDEKTNKHLTHIGYTKCTEL